MCQLAIGLNVAPYVAQVNPLGSAAGSAYRIRPDLSPVNPVLRLQADIQCLPWNSSFRRRPLNEGIEVLICAALLNMHVWKSFVDEIPCVNHKVDQLSVTDADF